jgi:hypothetical protein
VTAVDVVVTHDWRVVAPWWHWPRLDGDRAPGEVGKRRAARLGAPVLQKYDGPDLVNTFLADPQRRLEFVDDTDRVATVTATGIGALPHRSTDGGVRKLYLASHHRHYLVVCSLHCDTGGFPHARRDDVCQAGFVVRRRRGSLPGGPDGEAATELRRWASARGRVRRVEQTLRTDPGPLRREVLQRRLTALAAAELAARDRVRALAVEAVASGPVRALEGWVPVGVDDTGAPGPLPACPPATGSPQSRTPLTRVGLWQQVEELPERLTEAAFPLSPLIPDPTRPESDATGQTIYFGVVPTGSSDVDPSGAARFDDAAEYEVRCFVRRHRPECPRDGGHCGCPLFWSEPTEPYRLAGHFDLEGSGNRPVTVQLPDIAQLKADALRLGPGGSGGLRFSSPPNSELAFSTSDLTATKLPNAMQNAGAQICSFAIPLITIVAFFVLQLFLPIVVLIFQLWFLLALRFCIPPDASIDAGLVADFEALGGGLDIDAGAAATVIARPSFEAKLKELLNRFQPKGTSLAQALHDSHASTGTDRLDTPSYAAIGRAALAQAAAPPARRVFAPRVERSEVVSP